MSDRPQGEGWWLASDGRWYPPESHPSARQAAPQPPQYQQPASSPYGVQPGGTYPSGIEHGPREALTPGTTTAVRVFFLIAAVLSLAAAIATINEISKFNNFIGGSLRELAALADAEDLSTSIAGITFLSFLVLAVLFLIWMNKAYRAGQSRGATDRRWSSGWAVGAWFIPLANLVLPKLVMNEIEKMSSPEAGQPPLHDRWKHARLLAVGNWWWALYVGAAITFAVGVTLAGNELDSLDFNPDTYRTGLWITAVAYVTYAAAAVAGAIMTAELGRRLAE